MDKTPVKERKKVLPRLTPPVDAYFMGRLLIESACCKDPDIQHAALLVDSKDRPIAFGTNYIPRDYNNQSVNWDLEERMRTMISAEEAVIARALRQASDPFLAATLY